MPKYNSSATAAALKAVNLHCGALREARIRCCPVHASVSINALSPVSTLPSHSSVETAATWMTRDIRTGAERPAPLRRRHPVAHALCSQRSAGVNEFVHPLPRLPLRHQPAKTAMFLALVPSYPVRHLANTGARFTPQRWMVPPPCHVAMVSQCRIRKPFGIMDGDKPEPFSQLGLA